MTNLSEDPNVSIELLTEKVIDLVVKIDLKSGSLTYLNAASTKRTGWKIEDLSSPNLSDLVHPEDKEEVLRKFKAWIQTPSVPLYCDFRLRHKDQTWVGYFWKAVIIPKDENSLLVVALNHNERHSTNNDTFYRTIIDHIPLAVFCKDSWNDFNIVIWNKTCEQWWGPEEAHILGKNEIAYFPKEQHLAFRKADLSVMQSGNKIEIPEEPVIHKDRGQMKAHTFKVAVPDQSGKNRYLLGVSQDITETLSIQRQLEEHMLKSVARERFTLIGEMAGSMVHEINNPLSVVLLRADQLENVLNSQSPDINKAKKMLEIIKETTGRILQIVDGLRFFSPNSDRDKFVIEDTGRLIKGAVELCSLKLADNLVNIEIDNQYPELKIVCRSRQICQVIVNLLQNGIYEASKQSENRRVKIDCRESGEMVQIRISDSGQGIPPEIRDQIMQPFFSTKNSYESSGLGLSISKFIVEQHNGALFLDESSSETTFVIQLPKVQPIPATQSELASTE